MLSLQDSPWFHEISSEGLKNYILEILKKISYINWPYMPMMMKAIKILLSILGVLTFGPTFPSNS